MNIKDSAEIVEGRMTFIQSFVQKKYGWGILFFTVFVLCIGVSIWVYTIGIKDGKENSKSEISSLVNASKNDSIQIVIQKSNASYYRKMYDSCNKFSASQNLNDLVMKKLEEAESLKKIIERKVSDDKNFNKSVKKEINNLKQKQ